MSTRVAHNGDCNRHVLTHTVKNDVRIHATTPGNILRGPSSCNFGIRGRNVLGVQHLAPLTASAQVNNITPTYRSLSIKFSTTDTIKIIAIRPCTRAPFVVLRRTHTGLARFQIQVHPHGCRKQHGLGYSSTMEIHDNHEKKKIMNHVNLLLREHRLAVELGLFLHYIRNN